MIDFEVSIALVYMYNE